MDGKGWQTVGFEHNPVVEASWYGAAAYCRWAGKRLPTEAEWKRLREAPMHESIPGATAADKTRAQFGAGWNELKPVGSFPKGASPFGLVDAAGNGWEWVSSAYLPYPYNSKDGREDLSKDMVRGTRGGGHDVGIDELTTTHRGGSRAIRAAVIKHSFRCAHSAPERDDTSFGLLHSRNAHV